MQVGLFASFFESLKRKWSVDKHKQPKTDDVAIVGMGCRTAGGNNSPETLWKFLMDKKDASGEVPRQRWEPWLRRDARNAKEIAQTISKGYFLDHLENFDAAFFGISPKEAEQMDPHQRLALEITWEALENAGIDPRTLSGSDTAVYMGIDSDDYSRLLMEDIPNIEPWMGIGTAAHGVANRISYHLDLMGPSSAVDAACASSLVAVHLGRQAILAGESKVAIVGGVNVLCAPALTRMLGKAGALSPDGVCLSFDDAACGYARGEGGAVIILKKLSEAIADDDNILAVLKGSAIAQDGKTNGIMAPNAKAQELVARQALERASIDPLTVGYVEAHATSTSLGDPTEVSAISAVYGAGRPANDPAAIGSIKPNVGHLEAAAGAIGFVKAVLAVNKGVLAPQTRLKKLNTRIDWDKSGLQVVRESTKWSRSDGPRRAAVCSYGYGGTVSHAIIEQSTVDNSSDSINGQDEEANGPVILTFSATQEKRLAAQAAAHRDWLSSAGKDENLKAIASTLAQRRTHHDFRVALAVDSHDDAVRALEAYLKGASNEWLADGRVFGKDTKKDSVWVFSGHGAQWPDMGKELLKNSIFYNTVSSLDRVVQAESGFSAINALETGNFDASDKVQVLTYCVQIGLALVLKSKGVEPQAIVGHSVGEIAAAVAAGCLSPEEGALIVTRRATLYRNVKGLGGMALVNLSFAKATAELKGRKDIVAAIDSSPSSCVISGEKAALLKYVDNLKSRGVKTFEVKTDVAFHSPMLERLSQPLANALSKSLHPRPAEIPLYSTSHKDPRSNALRGVDYWVNNMTQPVWLTSAINAAVDDGYRLFLEVSSHPILLHSINEIVAEREVEEYATIPTMRRKMPAEKQIAHAIAQLYTKGAHIEFNAQFGRRWSPTVPGTQWAHKPYWREVETGPTGGAVTHDVDKHTLLGQRIPVAGTNQVVYTTKLDDKTKPFPGSHPLDGTEIIPAAVYVNTFHHATGCSEFTDIMLRIPVAMSSEPREVQIVVQDSEIKVASRLQQSDASAENTWISHSSGRWSASSPLKTEEVLDVEAIKKRIGTVLPNNFSVEYLSKIGVAGMAFPWGVTEHYGNTKEMIVKVDADPNTTSPTWDPYSWAPLLDAATSVGSTIWFDNPKLRIVGQIDKVSLYSPDPLPKVGYLYVEEASDAKSPAVHVSVLNEAGQLLAKFQSMRCPEVEATSGGNGSINGLVHQIAWVPPKFAEKPLTFSDIALISDDATTLNLYSQQLQKSVKNVFKLERAEELQQQKVLSALGNKNSAVVYVPGSVASLDNVASKVEQFIWEVVTIVKLVANTQLPTKVFVVTNSVFEGESMTALAHGPLYGLSRIVASEHPELWGGLIDNEGPLLPMLALKYVHEQDIVRVHDGLPRVARMRPLTKEQRHEPTTTKTLLPKPEGTYIITGGLGALGLEVCDFLVEKGARRVVLISRRALPPRRKWDSAPEEMKVLLQRLQLLEKLGATIYSVSIDIGAEDAHEQLLNKLDQLSLPPVLGVVHAAGVLEDSLVLETTRDSFARVLSPKISGALTLHRAFPPASLDFFVLFSSIGQLVGTSGQSSYGSGNAFLDTLAVHRRNQGDNAVAFQWTAWRSLGMATSTDFLTVELQSKGITDITRDEAFRAWEHLSKYDMSGAVVGRTLPLEEGEPIAVPILEQVVVRKASSRAGAPDAETKDTESMPTSPQEQKAWLSVKIRESIAAVLMIDDIDEIDARANVSDLGVDSVMTVTLRLKLQSALKVKVPPTLTWNHPTVNHLVEWFFKKFNEDKA
ncbi:6-methylsalicylic acid synthase [Saccharata proteae CBS 121410]|uniref:6-methylsalicylic acid synthase n=1 Tax=Saccharata proteae CBS 121410 TaxID=1314787 RepID=A0A9P4LWX6_9PEZI|nr:6-methylsalicylic acid synthase [Saccharata proteae CBS 121410]